MEGGHEKTREEDQAMEEKTTEDLGIFQVGGFSNVIFLGFLFSLTIMISVDKLYETLIQVLETPA